MDYLNTYIKLMQKAMDRNWTKKSAPVYTEGHHIFPKSWMPNNYIVQLTAKEHFVAHHLLHKAFPEDLKMSRAYAMMCTMSNDKQERSYKVSATRTAYAMELASQNMSGSHNHMYGKKHSEATRAKQRAARKGKKLSDTTRQRLRGKRPVMSGTNHPLSDHTVYNWTHKVHGDFTGTRYDLRDTFGDGKLYTKALGHVIQGLRNTHRGWKLKGINNEKQKNTKRGNT